jgi:single-stranded-DNA-specific exonuclease
MSQRYEHWNSKCKEKICTYEDLVSVIKERRSFKPITELNYGNHGLSDIIAVIVAAIKSNKKIALYADYDVDGTMSCVSWIWFLQAINYDNFTFYIPDRFKEGYGLNLKAIEYLVEEKKAEVIITMDCGITANKEALWCKDHGVTFICTDHHMIQPEIMPDCLILNPRLHPDDLYQHLCGCGITFVLLRKLSQHFEVSNNLWTDLLALAGMATICDCVPLNSVNHRLAKLGVKSLIKSKRKVFTELLRTSKTPTQVDEMDIGFRLGPRINAVGRLDHGKKVVEAFINENSSPLISYMDECNTTRQMLQKDIVAQAQVQALDYQDDPLLFLGGDWHKGVVGIAASKIADKFWKPVWLFSKQNEQIFCGSARSIPEFDVVKAMSSQKDLWINFGGHQAAGGFSFAAKDEAKIRSGLCAYAKSLKNKTPNIWSSKIDYDGEISLELLRPQLLQVLDDLKPFGHGFTTPVFMLTAKVLGFGHYNDKQSGEKKHTYVIVDLVKGSQRIMFFDQVIIDFVPNKTLKFLCQVSKNYWQGKYQMSLTGCDFTTA